MLVMTENDIATAVVDCAFHIHTGLGPGLLESVYEALLAHELERRGLNVSRQVAIPIVYGDVRLEEGFRADLIVQDKVLVELKSIEALQMVHRKQLRTYLKLSDRRLGLLINFGSVLIKDGIVRVVNGLKDH